MGKPRVLLDTNVLVSGLVFRGGNEHRILGLAEEGEIRLVLPEFVVEEARRVLGEKFGGYEVLLDVFLSRVGFEDVPWGSISGALRECEALLRDPDDAPVLASAVHLSPDVVVTGDRVLREDLSRHLPGVGVCSSSQFLRGLA